MFTVIENGLYLTFIYLHIIHLKGFLKLSGFYQILLFFSVPFDIKMGIAFSHINYIHKI